MRVQDNHSSDQPLTFGRRRLNDTPTLSIHHPSKFTNTRLSNGTSLFTMNSAEDDSRPSRLTMFREINTRLEGTFNALHKITMWLMTVKEAVNGFQRNTYLYYG
jgi:hypothetical protein